MVSKDTLIVGGICILAYVCLIAPAHIHGQTAGAGLKQPEKVAGVSNPHQPSPPYKPSDKPITQYFGENKAAYQRFGINGHDGIDIANSCGDPVKSPTNGRVTGIGNDPKGYGTFVWVAGYDGWRHLFGHTDTAVTVGTSVTKGTVIGSSNKTGNATGCHIHWSTLPPDAKPNGFAGFVDPMRWINESDVCPNLYGVPAEYGVPICTAASRYGADPSLLAAIIYYENRGWPATDKFVCSPAGACGIAQFMPATWEKYGLGGDPHNWIDSINAAANYLGRMHKSPRDSAVEYNCGPACKWNAETADYASQVTKLYEQFRS